jgi:hypothetical protein
VVLTIPLYCRDTFLHPACCARTAEPYGGGAPPLAAGAYLSFDSTGRLVEGATAGSWGGCELNIDAIKATTAEHWDRAGVAYLVHGFPDGCATDATRWASNHYHPNHKSAEGDVAAAHVRKTTEDDVRAGRVVDFGVLCRNQDELDAWATGAGHQGAVVAPLGFILKADGVSGRTLTDASWTGGTNADYSVNKRQLLKPRFSMASIAMFLACVRRLRAASRPGARLVIAKTDAADAYRRLRLQRQGVERHLYTSDGKLYGNVAVPFGEAPSAAAYSRGALAFGAYSFARVQARAARGGRRAPAASAVLGASAEGRRSRSLARATRGRTRLRRWPLHGDEKELRRSRASNRLPGLRDQTGPCSIRRCAKSAVGDVGDGACRGSARTCVKVETDTCCFVLFCCFVCSQTRDGCPFSEEHRSGQDERGERGQQLLSGVCLGGGRRAGGVSDLCTGLGHERR